MNRKGGTAFAAVVLAILGVSYLPRQGTESRSASEPAKRTPKPALGRKKNEAASSATKPIDACRQIANRLRRFYAVEPSPDSCYPEGTAVPDEVKPVATGKLGFVIAVVPNPVQTHLPLMFDRSIEAIQQAAQDESYVYDSSWFPWNTTEKSYELLSDQEEAEDLEEQAQKQPGIMVFRRGFYEQGLVVFVVAEQPTGGISDSQFENALQWMHVLGVDQSDEQLRILGPTFSGSLPSLARELEAKTIRQSPSKILNAFQQYPKGILIHSGTTSSEASEAGVLRFKQFLADKQVELKDGPNPGPQLHFRTFYESDSLMTDRFLCYLQGEGYQLSKVAILSEDETAFGGFVKPKRVGSCDFSNPENMPIYLYYPRDIATLRSAYERQSVFSAGKQQANAPSTTLRGDLSEPASSDHDTVRTYAGELTPQAQESVLFGITNILDSKHTEFVILRSSNTLDQLFLSEFLRRSYPSGRVVIDGSDLLFRRGIQGASLRGVLLLSSYPLLSRTQDSVPKFHGPFSRSYRVFAQDSSEGLYIAARELLDPTGETASIPISDYAPPRWALKDGEYTDNRRPATWITVVGHRQFWPVAVLNSNTQPEDPKLDAHGPAHSSLLEPAVEVFVPSLQKTGLPGEMVGLLIICLMLGLWHMYCCWKGSIIGTPRARAYFAPIARMEHPILVFLGSLLIGYLGLLLALSLRRGLGMLAAKTQVSALLTVVALVGLGLLACLTNYRIPVSLVGVSKDAWTRIHRWRRGAVGLWPLALILLVLLKYFLTSPLDDSNLVPTFWRSMYLRSGVSPLLPQVLLLLGLYAWFWFSLQGLSLFGADRPVLPRKEDLPKFIVPAELGGDCEDRQQVEGFRMFSREEAGDTIEKAARPLTGSYLTSLPVFLTVAVVASGIALNDIALRTLGDRRFGILIFLWICLSIAVILADALQFLRTWSRLRQLLIFLDRLRLRRTLAALKGLSWNSVWKMSGNVLEQRYCLISRQFESLRNLKNTLEAWKPTAGDEIRGRDATLEQLKTCDRRGILFAEWYVNLCDPRNPPPVTDLARLQGFQEELAATAACAMKQIIVPAWQKETRSLILKAESSGETSHDDDDKQRREDHSVDAIDKHVRAAEEFFVLPYLGFIQNTMGRIRSIAMSILALFVATTLAVSSYPFDPLPIIGMIFLITFLLVGTAVILVYAEMHRDATLSHITNTTPGELGLEFWGRLFAFGVGPLIGLLTTLFPAMTDFVVSWLQPGAQAIK